MDRLADPITDISTPYSRSSGCTPCLNPHAAVPNLWPQVQQELHDPCCAAPLRTEGANGGHLCISLKMRRAVAMSLSTWQAAMAPVKTCRLSTTPAWVAWR